MAFYRIIILSIFLVSCGLKGDLSKVLSPQELAQVNYIFSWPNLFVCQKLPDSYVCVTSNSKEAVVLSYDEWDTYGWNFVEIEREGFSRLIAEVKTLCQQDFKLECELLMDKVKLFELIRGKDD